MEIKINHVLQLAEKSHVLCGLCPLLIENEEIITVLRVMKETLGTGGNMALHWDREVSVGVNGSTGNSSIVTQSTPIGIDTHLIYFFLTLYTYSTALYMYRWCTNFTNSWWINTDTLQSWGTRTIIPAGWVVCMSADNKWRWTGGSVVLSEEQLVLWPSSSADFNWQCSLAWRP